MYEDPGIWAIAKSGCNTSCMSTKARENAQAKLAAAGFNMQCTSTKTSRYSGIGEGAKKVARWKLPVAVEVVPEPSDYGPSKTEWITHQIVINEVEGLCVRFLPLNPYV